MPYVTFIELIASCTLTAIATWGAVWAWYRYRYDNEKKIFKGLSKLHTMVKDIDKRLKKEAPHDPKT